MKCLEFSRKVGFTLPLKSALGGTRQVTYRQKDVFYLYEMTYLLWLVAMEEVLRNLQFSKLTYAALNATLTSAFPLKDQGSSLSDHKEAFSPSSSSLKGQSKDYLKTLSE